ncbi:hypothetical protein [Nitrosopumilus sp.]|uniref:hypothetical protein n=1 Tax=Nitrosopumilus sp. TaxID=2024843 RepID=UPI00247C1077|nr:hypothetical protein [Nitrosopumilus sp.]MCV0431841.1 hypothetical protein [Nitrosopumilus sp.]
MMQSSDSSFSKKYYPLILIAIGSFFLLFPFGLIGGEFSYYLAGIAGFIVLIIGVFLYYKKRTDYSSNLRKKMKIVGIIFLASLVAIPLIGVSMGVVVGLSNVFYNSSLQDDTRDIDTILLQTRILDWVNTNRVKNNVGGLNFDDTLDSLAKIRSLEMSSVPIDEAQSISDIDVNEIASQNNLECIIDGTYIPIHEYVLAIPHTKFTNIEEFVDFGMGFLIQQENEKEKVFASNMTRTGIGISLNDDYLVIVQTFC